MNKTYCHDCLNYQIVDDDHDEPVTYCGKNISGFPNVVNCKFFVYDSPLGTILVSDE